MNAPQPLAFVNARLVDPESGYDGPGGVIVSEGVITDVAKGREFGKLSKAVRVVDCGGALLAPGLIDLRVRTGEPGAETKETLASAAKAAAESYPPYNVEQRGERDVRITLAVAGFTPDDLSITLEGRQMTIAGKREPSGEDQAFLHRGIAARGFMRSFVLADGLEVSGAQLEHGLLHVDLTRPEGAQVVRRIPITAG